MSDDHGTVLPPDSVSLLERGLEKAWALLLDRCEPPFPELLNPETTPAEFLPWLAADRGVSEWRSNDSEQRKRRAIELAWPIRRLAGTRAALRNAIESLGYEASVQAWYEQATPGAPYSWKLRSRTPAGFDQADFDRLEARIAEAKAERDSIEHTVSAEVRAQARAFVGVYSGSEATVYPYIATDGTTSGSLSLAAATHSTSTMTTVYPDAAAINPYE